MYAAHFHLQREPFSIAPDPRFLYLSARHREALAHLLYGVGGGGGFVLLTGDIGAGKTTVCRAFLEQIPPDCRVAYIFNPKLTVLELLQSVCQEFHIPSPQAGAAQAGEAPSVKDWVDALNGHLLSSHAQGLRNVLIIDEAQNLSSEVLEQLRLLTNLETHERKLLQIILIGQPELRDMLAQPHMEQLAQRVIARCHLGPLSAEETAHYIQHRLSVAGYTHRGLFDRRALQRIHQLTGGVPRRINLLCDRALLGAYAGGLSQVGREVVKRAAQEVFVSPVARRARGEAQTTGRGASVLRMGKALQWASVLTLGLAGGLFWWWGDGGVHHVAPLALGTDTPMASTMSQTLSWPAPSGSQALPAEASRVRRMPPSGAPSMPASASSPSSVPGV